MPESPIAATVRGRAVRMLALVAFFVAGVFLTWSWIVGLKLPLPRHPLYHKLATTLLQTTFAIVIPYLAAWKWLGLTPARLGFTTRGFLPSLLWGCGLYAIALGAFLTCSDDPLLTRHPLARAEPWVAVAIVLVMGLHAAGTDFATRGYILLGLAEFGPVAFAILMQNVVWFVGHVYEIDLLARCMGLWPARGLFLLLGVLGDVIALRTRNVAGLAVAHVLLNVAMAFVIRNG
jgi:hypothetical protein